MQVYIANEQANARMELTPLLPIPRGGESQDLLVATLALFCNLISEFTGSVSSLHSIEDCFISFPMLKTWKIVAVSYFRSQFLVIFDLS